MLIECAENILLFLHTYCNLEIFFLTRDQKNKAVVFFSSTFTEAFDFSFRNSSAIMLGWHIPSGKRSESFPSPHSTDIFTVISSFKNRNVVWGDVDRDAKAKAMKKHKFE